MSIFYNKNEAQDSSVLLNQHIEQYTYFCPLINSECTIECVCFRGAEVKEVDTGINTEYHVNVPGCNNAMFFKD